MLIHAIFPCRAVPSLAIRPSGLGTHYSRRTSVSESVCPSSMPRSSIGHIVQVKVIAIVVVRLAHHDLLILIKGVPVMQEKNPHSMLPSQQTYYTIMTSLLRQTTSFWRNYVKMTSSWRYNDVVIITSSVRSTSVGSRYGSAFRFDITFALRMWPLVARLCLHKKVCFWCQCICHPGGQRDWGFIHRKLRLSRPFAEINYRDTLGFSAYLERFVKNTQRQHE